MKSLSKRTLRISIIVLFGLLFLISTAIAMRSVQSNAEPVWSVYGNDTFANCGKRVQGAGDVNGDGFADVLVFSNQAEGNIFAYYGSGTGLPITYQWSTFGSSFASAGDVNGDDFDDVLIGSPSINTGRGRVELYYGSADGLSQTPGWTASGVQNYENFGFNVSSSGDINGDGYSDVVISAPSYDNGQTDEGRLVVYNGSPDGLSADPTWVYESNIVSGKIGYYLTSGDANGDIYGDVVVAIPGSSTVSGFYGSAEGFNSNYDWSTGSDIPHIQDLSLNGDVNDDGYDDLLVSYSKDDPNASVFVYGGSADGLSLTSDYILGGGNEPLTFGWASDIAGDLNLDGFDDLIVSAPFSYTVDGAHGLVYVYLGSGGGITPVPDWRPQGEISGWTLSVFGYDISGVEDVNGDQYDDFLVGAPTRSSHGYGYNGAAYLYSMPTPTPVPPEVYRYFLPVVGVPVP